MGHIVGILQDDVDNRYEKLKKGLVPMETFGDIGGLDEQIWELEEVVKLPLTHPHLFQEVGIRPPNVVLLYGKSGTGKTLLAKVGPSISLLFHSIFFLIVEKILKRYVVSNINKYTTSIYKFIIVGLIYFY